jgi:hypothetical protein
MLADFLMITIALSFYWKLPGLFPLQSLRLICATFKGATLTRVIMQRDNNANLVFQPSFAPGVCCISQ